MNINNWLELFKKYWIDGDIESVTSLFSKDVEYFETPERKLKNIDEIKSEWAVVKNQDEIELELNLIGDIDGVYDVEWKLSHYKQGQMHKYKGIYKIRLNESGKCNYFVQIEG